MRSSKLILVPLVLVAITSGCSSSDAQDPVAGEDRTFVIPFVPELAGEPIACGKRYEGAGTTGASFELEDFLVYVHRVELIREGGEHVPLSLVDDQQWQGQDVTLLDFNDGTGSCKGDPETNDLVIGTAPDHDDYVGIAFDIGLPPELNHLDGVTAPAPFNKPSTWWSWKEGYKFFQLTLATEVHAPFYVHLGATSCEGTLEEGFSCAEDHEMRVEVSGFTPGADGVRLNVASLLSELDLDAPIAYEAGDVVAGCMSFDPDPECDLVFTKFGRHFMTDEPGPDQVVFEPAAGLAEALADPDEVDPTPQPGNPDFPRPPALDVSNVSERGVAASHAPGDLYPIGTRTYDRSPGTQCMHCHQTRGPGLGLFDVAGTIWNDDGTTTYSNATVKLLRIDAGPCLEEDEREQCAGQPIGWYDEAAVVATLEADAYGSVYTTELAADAEPPFWPVVVPAQADGLAPKFMPFPTASGACNMCHGAGLKIRLEPAG